MKNKKRLIKYFIIIAAILITALPMINFYQYAKQYDFKKLFNTDKIEMYVNYVVYKVFNRSLEQESVIAGKDGFLFLGNKYNNVLHKTNGVYRPSEKEIEEWTKKLKDLQTWYEERGIKFVIVIAPNKHSIYPEKLPNWMQYDGKTLTDDIVEFSQKKNINMLDLRQLLLEKKITKVYYTTDTHWNTKGSSIGYKETIKYINNKYKASYKLPKYALHATHRVSGDLANFLKINYVLPKDYETDYIYKFENESDVCHGNINEKHIIEKCSNKKNLVMQINRQDQYVINESSLNNEKLILLCDSFGTANSKLYNETFSTIWKFHYGHINGNELSKFISKHKPDVVIYQIVERALYSGTIVEKLSEISTSDYENRGISIFDINDIKYQYYKNKDVSILDKKLIATGNDPIVILNTLQTNSKFVRLNYDVDSPTDATFQLFYKENKNSKYSENDSYRVPLKKGNNKISLSIPAKYINNGLRVDLVSLKGEYTINEFKIYDY